MTYVPEELRQKIRRAIEKDGKPVFSKLFEMERLKNYIPSDYRHVQSVMDEKAEEMLERLFGPDWKEQINGCVEPPRQ